MSATGGASYSYSTYNSGDSWRASESVYDRPHHLPSHRRSPSPRRYTAYDRYLPPRSPHRSGSVWSNSYRPDSPPPISGRYHGNTPNPYLARSPSPWNSSKLTPNPYRRSPSPEHHFTSHVPGVEPWDSSSATAWLETSKQERQPSSPTPSISRDRGRRGSILATRMFEPSDLWKHTHSDRRDDTTARPLSPERSPTIHGDSYRPGLPHKDRPVVGRTGYDSYIPAYPSSTPDSRRKSSPRPRVRNMWPPSQSRSRSVSLSPREPRRSSAYQRRRSSRSRTPSHLGRSSSRRRTYSRSRRSTSRSVRSLSRGRRSVSRRRRSRYSHSRSSSRTRPSRGRSFSRGRSMSRTRSLRNGNPVAGHVGTLSGQNRRTRSRSRSSIASSIASSRASDRVTIQSVNLPVSKDINGSHDIKQMAQVSANIQSPPRTASMSKLLDGDTKKPESSQPPPPSTASDESKKVESESVVVTDAPVLQPPLPSPRSPIIVQHAEASDAQSTLTTSHLNGVMEHDSVLETAYIPASSSISPNTASNLSLPVPLVTDSPSRNHRNASPPLTDHQLPLASKKVVKPVVPSNNVPALLPTPQPTPDPSPQIRLEIKPPKPEDIPKLSEAKSTAEALRTVVMTRLLCDRQSREERVNPVLVANLQLAAQSQDPRPSSSAVSFIEEITEGRKEDREQFNSFRGSLVENFRHRQTVMSEKIQRLRKEYITLHERWVAHCASLDDQAKPAVTTESETVQPVTRSTRRSTTMSDAVRSDLEMEQIIASLGYDEATDPNQLSLRNLAIVPDMISVTNGQVEYLFDDTNHLVDNPSEYYGPTTGIHDWTDAEKQIFLNKFAAYPKQFGVIAEHIPNKTAAQCVDYYYLHKKKVIDFRKVVSQYAPSKRKRRGAGRKKGNGLLADIRQHDAEVHGESEAPPPPQPSGRTGRKRMTRPTPKEPREPKKPTASRRTTILQTEDTSTATPTPEPESRPRRRRVQSAVSTANATPTATPALLMMPAPLDTPAVTSIPPLARPSSASLSRTISVSVEDADDDPLDVERPAKRSRRSRKVKSAAIVNEELPDLAQGIKTSDQPESTTRRKVTPLPVQWSEEDKNLFLNLLGQYGDDFKRIAASMPNKTTVQVSNYYRTNLVDLDLEKVAAGAPKRSPTPESSKDSPQTTVPDSTPVMSSLTRDTSRATVKPTPREVPISSTIRSNLSHISKQSELASATTSPYAHLAYPGPVTNGRLGYTPNAIPPAPYPTIPYAYPSYNDTHYAHFASRTGQRPIAPHPDPDPTRRGTTVPSTHKGETLYPVLQESSVPPTSTPRSLALTSKDSGQI